MICNLKPNEVETHSSTSQSVMIRDLFPNETYGKILYKDEHLIRQIYDAVSAAANIDAALTEKLVDIASNSKYR